MNDLEQKNEYSMAGWLAIAAAVLTLPMFGLGFAVDIIGASVLFEKSHVLVVESTWFLARRDDAVVVSLPQGVATPPGAAMAHERCIGISQTGH